MKIKQKFSLLKRNTETREIAGQTFTFYPISVRMLFELRSNMEPLMKGLKALFSKTPAEGTQTVEETRDPMTGQVLARTTHLGAPDVAVLKARAEEQDKAMREAVEAVLGEKNRLMIGRVLADALRDEEIRTDAEVQEFITDPAFDLPILVEFLGGFFAVNTKVFGPFAQRVRDLIREKLATLTPNGQDASSSGDAPAMGQEQPNPFGSVGPNPS